MTAALRGWVIAMVGAACVSSVATALAPDGAGRRTVRFVCGLAMLLAFIGITGALKRLDLPLTMAEYRREAEKITGEARSGSSAATRAVIERECEAYILSRAAELGAEVTVSVTAEWEGGLWVPRHAAFQGSVSDEVRRKLEYAASAELGIPPDAQKWSTADEKG